MVLHIIREIAKFIIETLKGYPAKWPLLNFLYMMKKTIFLIIALFNVFAGICQNQSVKSEVIVTGTVSGVYPPGYSGKVSIPLFYYNPKTEASVFYSPLFQSPDSFYFHFSLEQPKLLQLIYEPVYLIPGDSVHVDYIYIENDKGNSRSSFTKIYSKLGYGGNMGYGNFISKKRSYLEYGKLEPKDKGNAEQMTDSICENLSALAMQYFERHKVSPDYRKVIRNDLNLLKFNAKLKLAYGDSLKIIRLLKTNLQLFNDDAYNSTAYFSAIGSLPEAFASLYPNKPLSVLKALNKYLHGETYLYASLIYANILRQQLPSYNNPYSSQFALNALEKSKDQDLISFANFILRQEKVDEKANAVLNKIKVRDYNGDSFTIKEILMHKKSKLKYIDIWASWCAPCIEGIPYSKSLPGKFKGSEIQSFFISEDENIQDWKNAYNKLGMQKEESYCILDKENLDLFQEALKIRAIPRYLLLDSLNTILLLHAPGPKKISVKFISPFLQPKSDLISPIPPPPPPSKKK